MCRFLCSSRTRGRQLLAGVLLAIVVSAPMVHAAGVRLADAPRTGIPKKFLSPQGAGDINVTHASVQQVIQCLVGQGISVSNVNFTGSPNALGTFTDGGPIIGFGSGVILSSGDATSVVGPNQGSATTAVNGFPGDPCLDQLIPGFSTLDACVLEFDFSCQTQSNFTIQYVFGSEEYNEFVNSNFNDVFGFFLDGCAPADNIATVPPTCSAPGIPVSINNVNCGKPFTTFGPNCDCYRNNDLNDGGGSINTELDGLTQVFSRTVTIPAGPHHLKIAIADAGDAALDSDVFLACQSLACVCPDSLAPLGVNLSGNCVLSTSPGDFCASLRWNAPSDQSSVVDTTSGLCVQVIQAAAAYDIRWSPSPIVNNLDFNTANQANGEPIPAAPGTPESFSFCNLPAGPVYVAMRSRDASFNDSPISSTQLFCDACADTVPPGQTALAGVCQHDSGGANICVNLSWPAPADSTQSSGPGGCVPGVRSAASYDVRWSTSPIANLADFNAANDPSGEPSPSSPGPPESYSFCGVPSGTITLYVAMQSRDAGGLASELSTVTVPCSRPPDCSHAVASELVLWPPDHTYHPISILNVTDPDGDPVTITVTSVTQDEPTNTRGDGSTCPDAQIVAGQASVRAERAGTPSVPGNGRVYTIGFTADDGHGGQCTDTVYVCVPHDQGDPTCINDGQRYNSLGSCRGGNQLGVEQASLAIGDVSNGQAHLTFALPVDGPVEIAAFDVVGRRLATIVSEVLPSGVYERDWNMGGIPRGLYFVRVQAVGVKLTRTVTKLQ